MPQLCEIAITRSLYRILNTVSNDHPIALVVALWIGEQEDIFRAVPQPWNKSGVDPTIWSALLQLVTRKLDQLPMRSILTGQGEAQFEQDLRLTSKEMELLTFLIACSTCENLVTLAEILSDGNGLTTKQVQALCVGATEAEFDEMLTGRLSRAGLIENGRASVALLSA